MKEKLERMKLEAKYRLDKLVFWIENHPAEAISIGSLVADLTIMGFRQMQIEKQKKLLKEFNDLRDEEINHRVFVIEETGKF